MSIGKPGSPPAERYHVLHPTALWRSLVIRPRVLAGAIVGAIGLALLLPYSSLGFSSALAWCLGGSTYLVLAAVEAFANDANAVKVRAARHDDSATVILVVILLAIFASFAAIVGLFADAKSADGLRKLMLLGLAAFTIVVAWTVMQTAFAFHYAHEHYAPDSQAGDRNGLQFPGESEPDYWDFFYFATSIGATSQTSDIAIGSRALRHIATLHAIVSFFFNTMVLAVAVNLAASLA